MELAEFRGIDRLLSRDETTNYALSFFLSSFLSFFVERFFLIARPFLSSPPRPTFPFVRVQLPRCSIIFISLNNRRRLVPVVNSGLDPRPDTHNQEFPDVAPADVCWLIS